MEREEQRDLWRPYLSTFMWTQIVLLVSYLSLFSRNIKTSCCGNKFVFRWCNFVKILWEVQMWSFCSCQMRTLHSVDLYRVKLDPTFDIPAFFYFLFFLFCRQVINKTTLSVSFQKKQNKKQNRSQAIRWHPWTWPPSLAPIFSTSRRALTRSSACRAQPGPRRARRSSPCCRGWSPASKPSSRSVMCISNIHSSAPPNTQSRFHILAQALE